jgi:hypothetical protein
MLSSGRWPGGGALLIGGGFIVVGCAKGGPGDTSFASGTDNIGLGPSSDDGGMSDAGGSSSGAGLDTPTGGDDMSGDDASGGDDAAPDCSPTTCPSGCCAFGKCTTTMADDACGQGGGVCTNCAATNQVCSFGSCIDSNSSGSGDDASPESADPGTGTSPGGGMTPPMNPLMSAATSCGGTACTNACFPLGLPCCTSAGACGCIALYFLPCQ